MNRERCHSHAYVLLFDTVSLKIEKLFWVGLKFNHTSPKKQRGFFSWWQKRKRFKAWEGLKGTTWWGMQTAPNCSDQPLANSKWGNEDLGLLTMGNWILWSLKVNFFLKYPRKKPRPAYNWTSASWGSKQRAQ